LGAALDMRELELPFASTQVQPQDLSKDPNGDSLREDIYNGNLLPYVHALKTLKGILRSGDPAIVSKDTFSRWCNGHAEDAWEHAEMDKDGNPIEAFGPKVRIEDGDFYRYKGENFRTKEGLQIQGQNPRNIKGMLLVPFGTNGALLVDIITRAKKRQKRRKAKKETDTK
jgi:hypothetical protein